MTEGITAISIAMAALLVLMATSIPVFVAFMIVNLVAVGLIMGSGAFGMFVNSLFETTTTLSLVTVPLFILMGEILFRSSAVDVVLGAVDRLLGRVKGRQYVLVILLAAIFSTLSGAAMGVAAMLGRSLLPSMIQRGYDPKLSAGNILAGASLAPLIPPSVLTIIIGTLAGVSISGLLVGGILPGLMLAVLFIGYTMIRIIRNPALAPAELEPHRKLSFRDVAISIGELLPFTVIIVMVMGLILAGVATPTEAGAMGVLGAIFVAAINRRLTVGLMWESLGSTALVSGMIMMIMASSKLFSQLLAFTGGATAVTNLVVGLDLPPLVMLVILLALPFVLCMFVDQIAIMLIVIPIYLPVVAHLGFDPIWFWVIFLVVITIGGITPPFGYTLFALKGVWTEGTLATVFSSAWPFVFIFVLGIAIMIAFPSIVTFLPSLI